MLIIRVAMFFMHVHYYFYRVLFSLLYIFINCWLILFPFEMTRKFYRVFKVLISLFLFLKNLILCIGLSALPLIFHKNFHALFTLFARQGSGLLTVKKLNFAHS